MPPKKASSEVEKKMNKLSIVRFIYLYLISAITFIVFIIGAVTIVDTALKVYAFDVDEYDYYSGPVEVCQPFFKGPEGEVINNVDYEPCVQRQKEMTGKRESRSISDESARRLSIGIAQVVVAFPLWIFHWRIIERDRKRKNQ